MDLTANLAVFGRADLSSEEVGDALADAAAKDAGDFFKFEVGFSRELSLRVGPVRAFLEGARHDPAREGAENTRTRDLADLMLLLDLGSCDPESVCRAAHAVFGTRNTHAVPREFEDPPKTWETEYGSLAAELSLAQASVEEAMSRLNVF